MINVRLAGLDMLSARWAHRALVGFCILLFVCVAIYVAYVGWLGPIAGQWAVWLLEPIVSRLQSAEHLDRFARVLGALGTLLTAAVGVYKGIYYADRNLPERLKNLFERTEVRLNRDRAPLLAATTGARTKTRPQSALFYEGPLNSALHELGFPRLDGAERELKAALSDIETKLEIARGHQKILESQKVTAHILRGSIAATTAESKAARGEPADSERALAESEFTAALELRPSDLDGLELRGKQRELRRHLEGAEEDFRALVSAAQADSDLLRAARGQRLLGQLRERQSSARAHWDSTRALYKGGIDILQQKGTLLEADHLEKALLHLGCARAQIRLGRIKIARTNVQEATKDLAKVKHLNVTAATAEATQLLESLQPPSDTKDQTDASTTKRSWFRRLLAG